MEACRHKVNDKIYLNVSLKKTNDIEEATKNVINSLQKAAKETNMESQLQYINIPQTEKLIAQKRRARAKWYRGQDDLLKPNLLLKICVTIVAQITLSTSVVLLTRFDSR